MKYQNIDEIKKRNLETGRYFFSEGAMRFFNSRVSGELFGEDGSVFITSERNDGMYEPPADRRYSVRQIQPDGDIETIGEFQQFSTLAEAKSFAKKYALEISLKITNE